MSIQTEVTRIKNNISSAYTAVSGKGGIIPAAANRTSANLADAIESIPIEAPNVTITVASNDSTLGTVSGGGTYVQGVSVTINATENNTQYPFLYWQKETVDDKGVVTTSRVTVSAQFEFKA